VFYNPAGILTTGGSPWSVSFGGTNIAPSFAFRDSLTGTKTNSVSNNVLVPNVYITHQSKLNGHDFALGFGVFAPYGLISEWPTTFAGRFLGYRSQIRSLYLQPTAAYRVNRWVQLGAGFDYIWTRVDLSQRVDLSSQIACATTTPTCPAGTTFGQLGIPAGTDFADAELWGHAFSASGHFGAIITPTSKLSLGARYLMRVRANIQGDAYFSQVSTGIILAPGNPFGVPGGTPLDAVLQPQFNGAGKLQQQHASTIVSQPDQLVLGAAYAVTPELTALVDYQWVNWSQFDSLKITFLNLPSTTQYEDYNNTNGWRFGLQYEKDGMALRGGYLHHDGASPDQTVTPLLPEGARNEFTLGGGIKVGTHGHLDIAYQHISQQDRRGRVVSAPRFSTAQNTGIYSGSASLLGASLTWGW
jgi:long-chain fatty acid transport protein